MEDKIIIENDIIIAFQDNHKDLMTARREGDYEEVLFCKGYEQAMHFVLSLLDIGYDEALNKKMVRIKAGKKVKQINNLVIKYTELYQYAIWKPNGQCWKYGMTLEQAEEFCRNTKKFIN